MDDLVAFSLDATPTFTPIVDKFYNAVGKVPHHEAIIPQEEVRLFGG